MPPKPRNNPAIPLDFTRVSFRKNHSIPIIHKGSALTSTAAIPEGTYCCAHASSPCPIKKNNAPSVNSGKIFSLLIFSLLLNRLNV